ncbi:MAG: hypothetical protein IKD10_11820 [Lentisphaeria bacterium]|nr:hypothetical protein [Lentisphaeria bacterium]
MHKFILNIFCSTALLGTLALHGANKVEYKNNTLENKLATPNVRFFTSFDRRHINPDFAKGYKKALSHSDISLELRGAMGFDGNPAYIPAKNEELAFMLKDNLDIKDGALSFWFRCDEFDPADEKLKMNIGVFNVEIPLKQGRYNAFAFFFGGQLYIASRFFDKNGNSIGIPIGVKVPGSKIGKGVWNQLTWSFDKENRHQFFLNGEALNRPTLLVIPPQITDFAVNKSSYMAFSCQVWNRPGRPYVVALDDITVYDQALPEAAVQAKYQALLKSGSKEVKLLVLSFDGKERGVSKVPLLRCKVDARAMSPAPKSANYILKKDNKVIKKGVMALEKGQGFILTEVPAQPQDYTFEVTVGKLTEKIPVRTPDFTFIGKYQRKDHVPQPWTMPVYNAKERSFKVWNRKYYFGSKGPFPTKIVTDKGINVLDKGPELYMDGKAVVWQNSKVKNGKSFVIFTGTGKGKDNSVVKYTTRLDFDGSMKTDFTVNGKPAVNNMTLEWKVGKDLLKYLMTPNYQAPANNGFYTFGYPQGNIFRTPCMLWPVSEDAGFCWMPEDDGNWLHSGNKDAFSIDMKSGKAVVKLIAKKCVIPDGVSYNSWFAATPTRPAPAQVRGNYGKHVIYNWWGSRHNAGYEPDPELAPSYLGIFARKSFAPYGMGHGQVLTNPMAQYMEIDWDAPGCFIYAMAVRGVDEKTKLYEHYTKTSRIANSNPCPSLKTLFNEWQVSQADKLLSSPWGDRISTLYYDLGSPFFFCGNEVHGCAYTDKFGRKITPTQVTGFRDQYIRLLDVARKYDTEIMSHGQDQFIPFVNGLTDWWLPGEQCSAMLRVDKYAYINKLRPYYMTEMNRKVLGCGSMFYSISLGSANRNYVKTSEITEILLAMMMLYDMDYLNPAEHTGYNFRVWNTYQDYGMHDKSVKVHRFDTQKEIKFDNPAIECTWYECPNGKLAAIVNVMDKPITTKVDVKALNIADGTVYDEYRNQPYKLENGTFTVTVPARNFVLVGLPAIKRFPAKDDFKFQWKRTLKNRLSSVGSPQLAVPTHDFGMVRSQPSALGAWPVHGDFIGGEQGQGGTNFYYGKFFPLREKKAATATVWCRSKNAHKNAIISLDVIVLDKDNKPLTDVMSVKATGLHRNEWEKLSITLPDLPNAVWVHVLLHASRGGRDGRIVFDDFTLE